MNDRSPRERANEESLGSFLVRGGTLTFLARAIAGLSGILTQVALARLLSPTQFGAFFLTQSVAIPSADVAQLGLPRVLVRELARLDPEAHRGRAAAILARAGFAALIGIALTVILYALVVGPTLSDRVFGSTAMSQTVTFAAIWIACLAFQNLSAESLRGFHAVGWAAVFGGPLASVLTCAVLVYVLYRQTSLELAEALLITAAGCALSAVAAATAISRKVGRPARGESPPFRPMLHSAFGMLALGIGATAFNQSDLWILGAILSEQDVALYGAAKRLALPITLPLMVVSLVVPPVISRLYSRGEHRLLERALRGTASVAAIPAIVLVACFVVFGEDILVTLFGDFYGLSALVLTVLSVERLLYVVAGSCGMLLMMTGHERSMLRAVFAAGALQAAMIYVGIRFHGIEGAALGFLGGSVVRTLALWSAARRFTGIRTEVSVRSARYGLSIVRNHLLPGSSPRD